MTVTYHADDEEISRLFEVDREKCIEFVYRKYWRLLYTYAFSIVKDSYVAEDILQDVFVNLWKGKGIRLRGGSMYAYLLSAVKYACIHYLKEKIKTIDMQLKIKELGTATTISEGVNILQDNDTNTDVVKWGIRKMPPKMKEIFLLRTFDEFSYRQISEKLGIAENTVKKQLYNAMKIFKNILNKNI